MSSGSTNFARRLLWIGYLWCTNSGYPGAAALFHRFNGIRDIPNAGAKVAIDTHTPRLQQGDAYAAGPVEDVAVVTLPNASAVTVRLEALAEEVILAGSSHVAITHVLEALAKTT